MIAQAALKSSLTVPGNAAPCGFTDHALGGFPRQFDDRWRTPSLLGVVSGLVVGRRFAVRFLKDVWGVRSCLESNKVFPADS